MQLLSWWVTSRAWPHLFANPCAQNPAHMHAASLRPIPLAPCMLNISSRGSPLPLSWSITFFSPFAWAVGANRFIVHLIPLARGCPWIMLPPRWQPAIAHPHLISLIKPPEYTDTCQRPLNEAFSAQYSVPDARERVGLFYLPSFQRPTQDP